MLMHFDDRNCPINMIIIHTTAMNLTDCIKIYNDLEVSAHYIIDEDGGINIGVDEKYRAWHAGKNSIWQQKNNLNACAIGIELLHPNLGQTPFPKQQIESLISLLKEITLKYNISPNNIVGHSDIAPDRKADPGKDFPWQELAFNGVGIWYDINDAKLVDNYNIEEMLASIGYDTTNITATSYAFCRRFLPELIESVPVCDLLDNPYPVDFDITKNQKFIDTVKAVYYKHQMTS